MQRYTKRRKLSTGAKIILVVLILFVVNISFYSLMPSLTLSGMINRHVDYKKLRQASEFGLEAESFNLKTEDGLKLSAWQVHVQQPKGIVIMLSGSEGPSITEYFGQAKMFQNKGFSAILVEMRSHGESEGKKVSYGMKEYLDVKAAVNYIKGKAEYDQLPVITFGTGMGAATAINAAGEIPGVDGVISLSAYTSWKDIIKEQYRKSGMPSFMITMESPFISMYLSMVFGRQDVAIRPEKEIKKLGDRPILLMHSKEDSEISFKNFERLRALAPKNTETFIKEGDYPFICDDNTFHEPEKDTEYAKAVFDFLDKYFR